MGFRDKIYRFLEGRYGMRGLSDAVQYFLAAIYLVLVLVNFFARSRIITAIEFVFIGITIFRILSKNIPARQNEDYKMRNLFFKAKAWGENQKRNQEERDHERAVKQERKQDKDHIYRECPHCKATLRLPKRKGKHTVRCPRCNQDFSIHVR